MARSRQSSSSTRRKERSLRASEREGIKLAVSRLEETGRALGNLMTEQCRQGDGWATYYAGTKAELVSAGIPEYLFANHRRPVRFRANGHEARLRRLGSTYELVLTWDRSGPWYHSAAHPALCELARMIHIDIGYWIGDLMDRRVPTEKLLADPRAVDYRLPASRRFRFSDGEKMRLNSIENQLFHAIQNAEILPEQAAPIDYAQAEADGLAAVQAAKRATRSALRRISRRVGR